MMDSKGRSLLVRLGLAMALGMAGATTSAAHDEPAPVNEGWKGGMPW